MSVQSFDCPKCGGPIPITDDTGRAVTCPFCNNTIIVPKELRAPGVTYHVHVETRQPPRPAPPPQPVRPIPQPKNSKGCTIAILATVGSIVVAWLAFGLLMAATTNLTPEPTPSVSLIVINHTGSTICRVTLTRPGSPTSAADYLAGRGPIQDQASATLDNLLFGSYDAAAYDCSGRLLGEDNTLYLGKGRNIWTVSPPQ